MWKLCLPNYLHHLQWFLCPYGNICPLWHYYWFVIHILCVKYSRHRQQWRRQPRLWLLWPPTIWTGRKHDSIKIVRCSILGNFGSASSGSTSTFYRCNSIFSYLLLTLKSMKTLGITINCNVDCYNYFFIFLLLALLTILFLLNLKILTLFTKLLHWLTSDLGVTM